MLPASFKAKPGLSAENGAKKGSFCRDFLERIGFWIDVWTIGLRAGLFPPLWLNQLRPAVLMLARGHEWESYAVSRSLGKLAGM